MALKRYRRTQTIPRQPRATDCAYLAGIIDGEGCVSAYRKNNGKNGYRHGYVLHIRVSMADKATLQWAQRTFGGYFWPGRKPRKPNHSPMWTWTATAAHCIEVLKAVYPYLKTKKRQAALLFKFRKVMQQTFRSKDEHRLFLRDEVIRQIHELNRRGAVQTVRTASSTEDDDPVGTSGRPEEVRGDATV